MAFRDCASFISIKPFIVQIVPNIIDWLVSLYMQPQNKGVSLNRQMKTDPHSLGNKQLTDTLNYCFYTFPAKFGKTNPSAEPHDGF